MLTPRRALFQVALSVFVVGLLALTSPRPARTQDGRAVPADVRVVNPNTAPVFSQIVNTASAPVQAKIVNALGAPVPANIINPATAPVQAKIVNGPAAPVQTSLVGSPIVGAKQSGVWNVSVGRNSEDPARQPFEIRTGLSFAAGADHAEDSFRVPDNKRLVIEYISLSGYHYNSESFSAFVRTQVASGGADAPIPIRADGDFGGLLYLSGSEQVRMYADPSTQVIAVMNRTATVGSAYFNINVCGHLVSMP